MSTKSPILRTPIGTACYPKLNTPDTKFNPEGKYRVRLKLTAEEAEPLITAIESASSEAYKNFCTELKKPKLKVATSLPYANETDDSGQETGNVLFNFSMKAGGERKDGTKWSSKPILVDSKGNKTDAQVWGGSRIKVAYTIYPWYTPALGVGISLQLKGVQIIELVSGGDSVASLGFGAEDGYVAEPAADDAVYTNSAEESTDAVAKAKGDF